MLLGQAKALSGAPERGKTSAPQQSARPAIFVPDQLILKTPGPQQGHDVGLDLPPITQPVPSRSPGSLSRGCGGSLGKQNE